MQHVDYLPACVGGLELAIFGTNTNPGAPIVIFAHGRTGSMHSSFGYCRELAQAGLISIAFDQRNHGRRIVDPRCSQPWNIHRASDMYGLLLGGAMDVGLIIDMLPARLGIITDRVGMSGISMGGHATLLAMTMDSRIQVGAPMIASGDYRRLMELRAVENKLPPEEFTRYYPDALQPLVDKYDPITHPERFADRPLLLSNGEADTLVQIECNQRLEAAIRPYYTQAERLSLVPYPGVGHAVPTEMWQTAKTWLIRWLLHESL